MRALKNALIILSLFFTYQSSIAQIDPLEKVSWEFSVEQTNCEAYIIGKATIVDKWHIYAAHLPEGGFALPTVMELEKSDKYEIIGKLLEPKPEKVHDEILNEDLYLHSGTIAFKQKIKILSNKKFKIKGTYSFQTCDDIQCLPPYDDVFEVKVKGCKLDEESNNSEMSFVLNETVNTDSTEKIEEQATIEFPKNKTEQTTTKKSEDKLTDKSLLTIFFLAFLSGFAALLTPCVFPMIPMTVSFFTKQSKTRAAGIRNAVIYGLSIIIIYVLLGTIITAIFGSDALNALSTNVYFNIFFFLLLIIFAISFLGAFEIVLPSSWVNKADSASNRGGLIG
ncbi:MAG: protein-disulfide reductase DsbD family protein, partial [Flavobacteriales bacterium]|nr:protein-disulfide reductase DsbD family protein [Flavobacteriales bacterium]